MSTLVQSKNRETALNRLAQHAVGGSIGLDDCTARRDGRNQKRERVEVIVEL